MVNITEWADVKYDKVQRLEMTTAYLKVVSPIIGMYDLICRFWFRSAMPVGSISFF